MVETLDSPNILCTFAENILEQIFLGSSFPGLEWAHEISNWLVSEASQLDLVAKYSSELKQIPILSLFTEEWAFSLNIQVLGWKGGDFGIDFVKIRESESEMLRE